MRRWMQSSLQRKLSVIIILSMIVPLLLLGVFAFTISTHITEDKARLSGMDTLTQMNNNLDFVIRDVENVSMFMISQQEIQRYMSSSREDSIARSEIIGLLTNLAASKKYIADITIYAPRFDTSLSTSALYHSELSSQVEISEVKHKQWTGVYEVENASGRQPVITFIRPLRSTHDYRPLGWLSISLNEKVLAQSWSVLPRIGDGQGQVWLINEQGHILSTADKSQLAVPLESSYPGLLAEIVPSASGTAEDGSLSYGKGEAKQTVMYQHNRAANWTLVMMIPSDQYTAQNRFILQLTLIVVLLSMLVSAALIWLVVSRVVQPLRHLTRLLYHSDPAYPLPAFAIESHDEIGRLSRSYHRFGNHIAQLKQQLIRNEARKKEADLRALEAQIHPHFMYNTLSSIHWIALMSGEKKIGAMVQGLSDFLRLSLNQGKDYCSVEQELNHIRNYMQVQEIRFPDKVRMSWAVDQSLYGHTMLKLLLQPLVENALIHGIQKKDTPGTITIHLEQESGWIRFMVLDDGIGIEPERLKQLRTMISQSIDSAAQERQPMEHSYSDTGYGLRNVNERLLLHYGAKSCLHIESRPQAGTQISFAIPLEEGYRENLDCG
ncbi:cache domain-containing sensor histidine kinase [Paenibacillus dauci]|uniref:cache domain-containing sensor histidine kinase n=1 Tax=Paenibacillus dauci TaxID=1567106 RepID=UPI000619AA63|nr:sensor histidine kinase [Paenibacillus dauci]